MKIAFLVIVAILVVLIALFLIARHIMPRTHHYFFAHNFLPRELFRDPASIIIPLIDINPGSTKSRDFLLQLWDVAGRASGGGILEADGLEHSAEIFGRDISCACFIQLPEPRKKPEAYFAAIVFDSVGLAVGAPRLLRYFVLEYHGEKNGSAKTMVGEWTPDGKNDLKYLSHGTDTQPVMTEFQDKVRQVIETPVSPTC